MENTLSNLSPKHAFTADPVKPLKAHPNKDKMPNLDGIRGFACLFVIVAHMPFPASVTLIGSVGVGIFFALSGFLMSYLYAKSEWNQDTMIKYGIARFSRIAPIYWLVISVCILLTQFGPDDFVLSIEGFRSIARHYLFSGNVGIFWSIPLEVQYYFFFVFIWWGIAHRTRLPYAAPLLALTCALLLLTHNYWPNLSVPNKLHYFLAGTIAGVLPRRVWEKPSDRLMLMLLQVGALAALLLPVFMFADIAALYDSISASIAFGVAIYLLSFSSGWTSAVFASPLIRKVGHASFSIYLIHMLVLHYGAHLLGLSMKHFEPLWVLLALAGVAIPMVISHYIEIPLQKVTRKSLDNLFMKKERETVSRPAEVAIAKE